MIENITTPTMITIATANSTSVTTIEIVTEAPRSITNKRRTATSLDFVVLRTVSPKIVHRNLCEMQPAVFVLSLSDQ